MGDNGTASQLKRLRSNPSRQELEDFRMENPGTPEAATAVMLLDSLENATWNSALAANDTEKMKEYLDEYPSGIHATEAAMWMDEMNRTGEAEVEADTVTIIPEDIRPVAPDKNNPKPAAPKKPKPKPKPTAPKPATPTQKPTPAPTKPKVEPTKPDPVDPNKPVALVSAAKRPVFKNCGNSNRAKEEKCTTDKIYSYLKNRFEYPKEAMDKHIEGTVVVSFVVERDGSITDVRALNDIGGGCAKEAVKLIKSLPKFKPGLNVKGDAIRVQYTQSIRFDLK